MTNRIMQAIYDAIEHAVCAGDFIQTDCMCLASGNIYMTVDGKAYMDTDDSFYDVWYATDMLNARQVLAMTEQEILEQIDRLQ